MKFNREQFVEDMRDLARQGIRFRHQGKDVATGLDCIHAPKIGYEKQGLRLPEELDREFDAYTENPDGWKMIEIMRKWFQEIPVVDNQVPDAEPGDLLVLYAIRNPKHVAILVSKEPLTIVEAYRSVDTRTGKLIEWPLDSRRRIAACFRIPDFA